jgi:hypothetical protein
MTRKTCALCCAFLLCISGAAVAMPKERLLGQWSGSGQLIHPDTGNELRLMCRLQGQGDDAGQLALTLRCATLQQAQTVALTVEYDPMGAVRAVTTNRPDGSDVPIEFVADDSRLTLSDPAAGVLELLSSSGAMTLVISSPDLGAGRLDLTPD